MTETRSPYKTKLSKKPKFAHGGPRANSGGPRTPGPGKVLGRPKRFGSLMISKSVHVPPAWIPLLLAYGEGDFAEGVRRVVQESGVVDAA